MHTTNKRVKKTFSRFKKPFTDFPSLIENQLVSFEWLVANGFKEVFKEFSPIKDYSGKKFELDFVSFSLSEPKCSEEDAKFNQVTYEGQLKARVKLTNKSLSSSKEQEIFMADIPLMTAHGTFIINGVERVIVPQLARSFGVFFTDQELKGKRYFGAKIIPARGVWIEIDSEVDGGLYVRIDKKRKFNVITLLRALGLDKDEDIIQACGKNTKLKDVLNALIAKDTSKDRANAYLEMYKKLRDGDLADENNAREYVEAIMSPERYDLSPVGRYRFNKRFDKSLDEKVLEIRTLSADDIMSILAHIIYLNETPNSKSDDIDHLGQRRVRYVGEMLQQKIRVGFTQMKRNIQDRMSTIDIDTTLPVQILNQRPLEARIKEFFTTNQLSQFMNQENVLAELEHLRTLSALGPGGLTRERAGLEVRDVHTSHYGRVCPIHTPEGPNIGLILHLATYAKINEFGIIETPYVKVVKGKITGEIVYLNALEEERSIIAHAALAYDDKGMITEDFVESRIRTSPGLARREDVDYVDVAPNQAFSLATSMIPFLEHDEGTRALMGSNMQKQAVPCIIPMAPLVATGIEALAGRDSGRLVLSRNHGTVTYVDGKRIMIKDKDSKNHTYSLVNFSRTNNFNVFHQRPVVNIGDTVKVGDILADTSSTVNGEIALGQNVRVAFMTWNGANFEDAIILSEDLVRRSIFTSIYTTEFVCNVRDTKLGPEQTTRDIPNVGELKLKDLDEDGIIRIGAEVRENDILVGKITPKGETELTPEERLLRSIFAEKARDVKDTSLRLEHGKKGRVVGVKVFSREAGHKLESGILKRIIIEIAQVRNISVGDKLAGRHGNKGVISRILPIEEMPYMADGTPMEVLLTPLGIPSRMNLGQILELHLGYAADKLGYQAIVPPFMSATVGEIQEELVKAGMPESGRVRLYDGRTGEAFDQDVAIGMKYMLKLHHMVEDKLHMRAIGPYSLITQQPLGGKAQSGGQRFGEMEVWALEGYGASNILREMLTVKSDDIQGRSQTFDAIIKGNVIPEPHSPASFNVMLSYLRGLALDVDLRKISNDEVEEQNEMPITPEVEEIMSESVNDLEANDIQN
jgi:DNA-directed RNA polymerase subunit beta